MTRADAPLVTIAIPTYNRADLFLKGALEAALGQSYANLEVLVSDNASTDGTEALVSGYDDPRLRYVRQEANLGANGNFNWLLEHARGEYFLLFLDDDVIDLDFVETCVDALARRPGARMVRTGSRTSFDGVLGSEKRNETDGLAPAEFFLAYFDGRTSIYFCTTLFHTATLRGFGGLHSKHELFEDCVAVTRFVASHPRVDVPEAHATFRRHDLNRGSSIAIDKWSEDALFLLEEMCRASGDRAPEVRRRGLRFFTERNYDRLARTGARTPAAYWSVYRAFERRYHPARYAFDRYVVRRSRRVLRRLPRASS